VLTPLAGVRSEHQADAATAWSMSPRRQNFSRGLPACAPAFLGIDALPAGVVDEWHPAPGRQIAQARGAGKGAGLQLTHIREQDFTVATAPFVPMIPDGPRSIQATAYRSRVPATRPASFGMTPRAASNGTPGIGRPR